MAGYTASSRVPSVAPRARWGRAPGKVAVAVRPAAEPDATIEVTTTELIGRPREKAKAERMATLRETFVQTRFFLFCPGGGSGEGNGG